MPSLQHFRLTGRCACGATTYTSTSDANSLDFCYCLTCQRVSGAPFVAWLGVTRSSLDWIGPIREFRPSPVASRGYCEGCGATLYMQYDCLPDRRHVSAGTVVSGQIPASATHIFTKDAPSWYTIPHDESPKYDQFDDEFAAKYSETVSRLQER